MTLLAALASAEAVDGGGVAREAAAREYLAQRIGGDLLECLLFEGRRASSFLRSARAPLLGKKRQAVIKAATVLLDVLPHLQGQTLLGFPALGIEGIPRWSGLPSAAQLVQLRDLFAGGFIDDQEADDRRLAKQAAVETRHFSIVMTRIGLDNPYSEDPALKLPTEPVLIGPAELMAFGIVCKVGGRASIALWKKARQRALGHVRGEFSARLKNETRAALLDPMLRKSTERSRARAKAALRTLARESGTVRRRLRLAASP